jgi:hypothetical protein
MEWIEGGLKASAEECLAGSDMVKYAKYIPPAEDIDSRVGQVETFIEKTIPSINTENNQDIQQDKIDN